MKLQDYSSAIWDNLPCNADDMYKGIQLFPDVSNISIFFFRDEREIKHLLIESPSEFSLPEVRGLGYSFRKVNINKTGEKIYFDLVCTHEAFLENFTILTRSVLSRIDADNCDVSAEIISEINLWRLFLEKPVEGLLSIEEQLGIIGELLLLKKIALMDSDLALKYWCADKGEIDFVSGLKLIEVKASSSGKHTHIINGLDQLKISDDKELYILSFAFLRSDIYTDFNLTDVIADTSLIFRNDPVSNRDFYVKLRNRNFNMFDIQKYKNYCFSLIDAKLFSVTVETPRLTSDNLKKPLNPRISKIRYTLDLDGLESTDFNKLDISKFLDL